MPRISGNESFSQLYNKMAEIRGDHALMKGGRKVTISSNSRLDTARVAWSGAGQKRASEQIFASIQKEYGRDVAERVFQHVIGNSGSQKPTVTLDHLREIRNQLVYFKPIHEADPTSRRAVRFSDVYQQMDVERRRRNLSGDKHLRFKGARGLYLHKTSLGSATGLGNLWSGEVPEHKRQAAGARIWKSLANQFDRDTADQIFKNVFGDRVVSDDGSVPHVAVTLDQLDEIAAEVERRSPEALFQPISTGARNRAHLRLKSRPSRTALNETLTRVAMDSSRSKVDDLTLEEYLNPKLKVDADEPELKTIAKPHTDHQRHTSRLFNDNPAGAWQMLGDLSYLIENADRIGIDKNQQRRLGSLLRATQDALGVSRIAGDQSMRDVGISKGDQQAFEDLGRIVSLVRSAKEGHQPLSDAALDDLRNLAIDIGARFRSRLETEQANQKRLEAFGADLRRLGTGSEDAADPDPDQRAQQPRGKLKPGLVDKPVTPLQDWHQARVRLHTIDSTIAVLSGDDIRGVSEEVAKQRKVANDNIRALQKQLEPKKGRIVSKQDLKSIQDEIVAQQADLRRLDQAENNARSNRQRLLKSMDIDPDDVKSQKDALRQLRNQREELAQEVILTKRVHMNDSLTKKMASTYADLGFRGDVDYLDTNADSFQTPMLQNRAVASMRVAASQMIPALLQDIDELRSD